MVLIDSFIIIDSVQTDINFYCRSKRKNSKGLKDEANFVAKVCLSTDVEDYYLNWTENIITENDIVIYDLTIERVVYLVSG